MIPLLLLWLCWVHFTNQEICSSPGNLSAPQLLLDKTSYEEGVSLVLKCKVPALSPFSRVIFCKDGKDLGSWPMQETKFAYSYRVSMNNTGRFTCLYQHKDDQNQEKNSLLSDSQNLDVTDAIPTSNRNVSEVQPLPNGSSSNLILGITIPSTLVLVVVCSLLARTVLLKRRDTREHGPSEEIPKSPEDRTEYSTIIGFGRASTQGSQPSGDTVVTYTTVDHCTDRTAGLSPAGETDDLHPDGTVLLKRRDTREHGPSEEIPKSPEDRTEYSTIIGFGRASTQGSQPSGDTVVTYTTVDHCTDRTAGLSPAGETDDLHPDGTGFGV